MIDWIECEIPNHILRLSGKLLGNWSRQQTAQAALYHFGSISHEFRKSILFEFLLSETGKQIIDKSRRD